MMDTLSTSSFNTEIGPDGYRRATAPSDLKAGSIVSSEPSFSTVLFRSQCHRYCSFCTSSFPEEHKGKRCLGGCEYTYYCSRDCQLKDYSIHKYTCKKYHTILGNAVKLYVTNENVNHDMAAFSFQDFPWEDFMLARKVYIKLCNDANISVKKQQSVKDVSLPMQIQSLSEGVDFDSSNSCSRYAGERALALIVAASFQLDPDGAIPYFESLLCRFRCNNFGIQNAMQTVIGHGVFPIGAILNHACDPNCILTYSGNMQVIRTISSVKEGEELFHSYTDVCQPTIVRKEHLQMTYGFECLCSRCRGEGRWTDIENSLTSTLQGGFMENEKMLVERAIQTAIQISADNLDDDIENVRREYDCLRTALSIQKRKLGPFHLERYKTECLALCASMLLNGGEVIEHAENAVKFLGHVCNKYHPLVLLQEMTLAELYLANGNLSKGRKMIQQLIEKCEISFGKEYEYISSYRKMLADI